MADLPPHPLNRGVLVFLVALVSGAFSAGITFALWSAAHPTEIEIASGLGCSVYGGQLKACPAASDAKEARREVMTVAADLAAMRRDLSRGFGRCLAIPASARAEMGSRAVRLYDNERAMGVPPAVAMSHVIEGDFP